MKATKTLFVAMLFAGIMGYSSIASACCSFTTGTVASTAYLENGIFFFSLSGAISGKPACNTQNRFAFNSLSPVNKNLLAYVLSAKASGDSLTVVGLQTCTTWSDSDDVGSISAP